MKNRVKQLVLLFGLAMASTPVLAAEGTPWDKLSDEQQAMLLKAHQDHWNRMPAESQQRMLEGAQRWQAMTPEERERIRAKREKFRSMPPDERAQLRQRHLQRHEAFENLPPEQQRAMRESRPRRPPGPREDCIPQGPPHPPPGPARE